jgi:hypothetical protein
MIVMWKQTHINRAGENFAINFLTYPTGETIFKLVTKVRNWHKAVKKKSCFICERTWWHWSSIRKFSSKIFAAISTTKWCFCRQCVDRNETLAYLFHGYVECLRLSCANTTVLFCRYTDTPAAVGPEKGHLRRTTDVDLKRGRCVGDTLDGRRFSLRKAPVAWGTLWMLVGLLCGSFDQRFAILPVRYEAPIARGTRRMVVGLLCWRLDCQFAILPVRYGWSAHCSGDTPDGRRSFLLTSWAPVCDITGEVGWSARCVGSPLDAHRSSMKWPSAIPVVP